MAWFILFLAGLSEIAWAVGLKYTQGFTKPFVSFLTVFFLFLSIGLLGLSMKSLPMSLAYSVWVVIGMLGTVFSGVLLFGDALSVSKLVSILLIVCGVIGLKISS